MRTANPYVTNLDPHRFAAPGDDLPARLRSGDVAPSGDPFAAYWVGANGPQQAAPQPARHPAFDRIMARIPLDSRRTFTPDQLMALSLASVPVNSKHVIDYRVSVPFFGRRFYLTLLAGREQRSKARLAAEMQLASVQIKNRNPVILALMFTLAIFAGVTGLYIIKSALGVDMFEGDSALHDIFKVLENRP